jgi:hypothetical protein
MEGLRGNVTQIILLVVSQIGTIGPIEDINKIARRLQNFPEMTALLRSALGYAPELLQTGFKASQFFAPAGNIFQFPPKFSAGNPILQPLIPLLQLVMLAFDILMKTLAEKTVVRGLVYIAYIKNPPVLKRCNYIVRGKELLGNFIAVALTLL